MKNKLIILLLLFTTWQANAQKTDYIKLLDTTNRWYCSELMEFEELYTVALKLGNTHIYDDTAYFELNAFLPSKSQAFLREDTITKKVYINPYVEKTGDQILYDFSLKEGDSILLMNPYYHLRWYYVDSVRTIQTLIDERKVWYLNDNEYLNQYPIWVEGIGSLAGILKPSYSPTLCCWGWGELNCFYNDETLVFQSALAQQYGCLFENMDLTPPVIDSIWFEPDTIASNDTVKFYIKATDDISGVRSFYTSVHTQNGGHVDHGGNLIHAYDDVYYCKLTHCNWDEIGMWYSYFVVGWDYEGNEAQKSFSYNANFYVDEIVKVNNKLTNQNIKLYPNPASDILFVKIKNNENLQYRIKISDMLGNVIKQENINSNKQEVDISNYQSGIYFIKIISDNQTIHTNKFIVKH